MSIKKYTLSEVGAFFKAVILAERSKKAQSISEIWQGTNLSSDGLNQVLDSLGSGFAKKEEPVLSKEEVTSEWKRLASFMATQQG